MNYKNLVLSLGLVAAAAGVSFGQTINDPNDPVLFSESRLTFNLTLEYQVPNLKPKNIEGKAEAGVRRTTNQWNVQKNGKTGISDNYIYNELGQTSVKVRYGNREILEDLVAQNAFPRLTSSVGWYITLFANAQGQPVAIYARHPTITAIRLDPTYVSLPGITALPSLTQRPTDAVTDPLSTANAVDTYTYSGHVRNDIRLTSNITTYFTKGVRKTTTRNALRIAFNNRFISPLVGDVRLVIESNVNAGAPYPPTWIVKSIKSTGAILSGQRRVRDEANAVRDVQFLADGTIVGIAGVPYYSTGDLPSGVTLTP